MAFLLARLLDKRGLPHAHILLFMHPTNKPRSPSDIDRFISTTEIPDRLRRPRSRAVIDEVGFSKYKRPDNGRTITKRNVIIGNSFIVPYNPYLLLRYGYHINIEHTCQTFATKYLFKHLYKGSDRIKEPVVIRLPFHFLEEHVVIFRDDDNIQDVLNRVNGKLTKLLAWFLANTLNPFAKLLTYSEFPNKFVWKDDKGCTSFVDLRIVYDVIYDAFKEAYYTLGILQDDKEFVDAILEANDRFLMDEMNFDRELLREELKDSLKSMTHEQKNAYYQILNAISMDLGGFYFVYGYSDTGKTFLYRTLSVSLRCNGKIVLNVASSGITSLLLPNRHNTHSRFKIPLNINEDSDIVQSSNNSSYIWDYCNVLKLYRNMHLSSSSCSQDNCEIMDFANWLIHIGDGLAGDSIDGESEVLIPDDILIDDTDTSFKELI
ncbi:uncharacterized protein LOC107488606 [Arachis duranensis]|uniref:ATP-dependent DNA helicase n=1 Tax=Arachis duranensis TaxID=130453 RepID=A0A6P4DCQ8_ARADU|nr:uncharacterized protein LOC107488606 [Arachis duranensis]